MSAPVFPHHLVLAQLTLSLTEVILKEGATMSVSKSELSIVEPSHELENVINKAVLRAESSEVRLKGVCENISS